MPFICPTATPITGPASQVPNAGPARKPTKNVAAAFGIDNVNNYKFWNFHPYPQRSYVAELKVDL